MLTKLEMMTEVPVNVLETQLSDLLEQGQYVILTPINGDHDFDTKGFENFKTFSLEEFDFIYDSLKVYEAITDAYRINSIEMYLEMVLTRNDEVLATLLG